MSNPLPGWAQRRTATPSPNRTSPPDQHPDATASDGSSTRLKLGVAYIDDWIRERPGVFDTGTTDAFDALIRSLGKTWECEDELRHTAEMADLERRISAAEAKVTAAENAVQKATDAVQVAYQNWAAARARLGVPPLPQNATGLPAATQSTKTGNCTAVSNLPSRGRRRNDQ